MLAIAQEYLLTLAVSAAVSYTSSSDGIGNIAIFAQPTVSRTYGNRLGQTCLEVKRDFCGLPKAQQMQTNGCLAAG